MKKLIFVFLLLCTVSFGSSVGVVEKLGNYVPLDLKFLDENGKEVTLKSLMDGKVTLLTLNYFECPGICTPQLNELAKVLNKLDLKENYEYKVITVSFAEDEKPSLAKAKKKNMIASIGRKFDPDAWRFVIGENNSSKKLMDAVGFRVKKVKREDGGVGYVHEAAIIILSPDGKITRYLRGINQLPKDIELAVYEARFGKVSERIPKESPFCYTKTPEGDKIVAKVKEFWFFFMLIVLSALFIYLRRISNNKKN